MGNDRGPSKLKVYDGGWSLAAKPCDSCKSAPASLFCRHDSAFLCISCDSKIHSLINKFACHHERVWMCEVCEQAPASVTCKADAAALCVTCDSDIHSANPLARRHERIPIQPFFDSAESIIKAYSDAALNLLVPTDESIVGEDSNHLAESDPCLLPNPNFNAKIIDCPDVKPGDFNFFPEMDPFMDFDDPNSIFQHDNPSAGADSVVPVQTKSTTPAPVFNYSSENCFDINFCRSKLSAFSQSVSSSSVEVGIVPDGNSGSEISFSMGRSMSNNGGGGESGGAAIQLYGLDREARVLRYREKRKNRKFEKTIRYASRKAYAEQRPRIKGRFAKRTETETDVDGLFNGTAASNSGLLIDAQYGVVPTF